MNDEAQTQDPQDGEPIEENAPGFEGALGQVSSDPDAAEAQQRSEEGALADVTPPAEGEPADEPAADES
jgi:hypothetical protein